MKFNNILILSSTEWHAPWTRRQQFSLLWAENSSRVLFVEPPYSLTTMLRFPEKSLSFSFNYKLNEIQKNIWVTSPPTLLPFYSRSKTINCINQHILTQIVNKIIYKINLGNPLIFICHPLFVKALKNLRYQFLVYDCADEFSAYPRASQKLIKSLEKRLLNLADAVWVSASGLFEARKELNMNTFLVPNGVNFERFANSIYDNEICPVDLREIERPRVGFVGSVYEWIDLDLIKYAAQRRKNWHFVFVGYVRRNIDSHFLTGFNNLHFLGPKRYEDIPSYVKSFDVCIAPFKQNMLTQTVNPLKVYEYLAAGKPVVTTPMAELQKINDVLYIADTQEKFLSYIELAIKEDSSEKILSRREVAKRFDWHRIFCNASKQLLSLMDKG